MNIARNIFFDPKTSRTRPAWRGHLFLFDKPQVTSHSSRQGSHLLLVFLFVEVMVRPLLRVAARRLIIADRDWWPLLQVTILTALVCWLVSKFVRVRLSQLGLYSWRRWSRTEKFYFLQIIPISILVPTIFVSGELRALWTRPNLWRIGLFIFVEQMIWGFYQEFVYRGLLQTELIRRLGIRSGILVSNLIFTFGPLHAYHFWAARRHPSHLWIFAAIFGIGLFFAILFKRSGNLWIIGIMHGIGDFFIDGLAKVSKLGG